jgi:BTB/POZ domain
MRLPHECELDLDGDLHLILFDHCDTEGAIVEHLKKTSSVSIAQRNTRLKRSLSGQLKGAVAAETSDPQACPSPVDDKEPREIRLRVSSKHLTLASPVFKALLRGGFAERTDLDTEDIAQVHLPDDDASAFWLLLYVIHGQPKKVPSTLSLRMLARVTVVIDKYQLHEVAEMVTDS